MPLEEEMTPHSSILIWEMPWTEEPGRLSPWGCKESDTTERTEYTRVCAALYCIALYTNGKVQKTYNCVKQNLVSIGTATTKVKS